MKEYILLIPNSIKKNIIENVRKTYYNYNIKFMSLDEFIKRYTFSYDNETIYHIMKKYNIKYSSALVYLDNLYYISDKLDNEKMNKLKEIKKYLDDNNLLIYDKYFRRYVKDKEIYIYGYDYINKYYRNILSDLNYKVINIDSGKYEIDKIYYSDDITDEVIFVASKICELIKRGICTSNIKLVCSSEYNHVIDRIFKLYGININKKINIYSIYEVKRILDNLNDIDNIIDSIKNIDIRNKIINVINNYSFIANKEDVRELIIHDFKNTYLDSYEEGINVISLDNYIDDNDYVFLLGFNKENIPRLYKDNDYFTDKEKEILGFDTSIYLNSRKRESTIKKIHSIKNLFISYKSFDVSNNYTKSDLLDNVLEEKIINNDYSNSNMINRILLTEKLDNLVKYNIMEDDINLLYSNYQDIDYMKYSNKYNRIDKDKLYKYLDDKLVLAYTSFDNYNRCKFKYYLNNILKINIIRDDFAIIIGNVCHYVLSKMDNEEFDTKRYFDEYLKKEREFTSRELFFLDNIKEEMVFIIDTIRKQLGYTSFDKKMYEEKVYVNKDKNIKVTFMGVIDKILYKEEDGITYLAVIDYKTGNTNIKLDNMEYGIDMQLPIYLYLTSNMKFKDIEVVGFYLQKLLGTNLDNTKDYMTARENNLKLEGYSINNPSILSKFDKTYNDSKLIKSMKTSKNGFYNYSKVLDKEEIDDIITSTDEMIDKAIDNILEADFTINPKVIDGDNVSCKYCEYKDICFRRENDIVYINRREEEYE
ncbi:MAG: PD-(D/E)XK nuclease family protein [Bacilli bacterium]